LNPIFAQKKMTLQECIDFALENNYEVKQKMLDKESKNIQLQTTKTTIAPSLGANVGQNFDFGRAKLANNLEDNTTQATTNFGVGLNMDLFQGLRTHHQMKSDKLNLEATLFDIESAKENIELMVSANYLQILLNKEMLEVFNAQVLLAQEQVDRIQILVNNGKNSDAELYAVKSTLANDQLSVVEARNAVRLAILDLAQLMNYPDVANFDITSDNNSAVDEILDNNIDVNTVVNNALNNRPAIQAALLRIELAKRNIKISQSGWYPNLSFSASVGTGYFYNFKNIGLISLNDPFGTQFKGHARESVGISLYIPIFDKLSTHYNVKQQKISVKSQELQLEETKRKLIKEIEQAYTNAVASKEKYLASQIAYTSSLVAFQYEEVKYNAGSSTNYEYNEAKNKYLRAQSNLIQAKFDFLFRVKILEFYGKA
jgi:outer membrane protein